MAKIKGGKNMEYRYTPEGVCSMQMIFEIENDIIKSLNALQSVKYM